MYLKDMSITPLKMYVQNEGRNTNLDVRFFAIPIASVLCHRIKLLGHLLESDDVIGPFKGKVFGNGTFQLSG